ncbi:MAG: hypothetical protein Fur0046_33110 [Cyanobacteria bacterium J069]|nr:MAG: phycobilisome protein [Cyanobacteria bacterium J069]
MLTLSHTLDRCLRNADGTYLDQQGLQTLSTYVQTYQTRLDAYQQLRDRSSEMIHQALKKLAQAHPELIQQHGQRCLYDMTEVVRYIALSVLRDDETFFKEQMMSWLDTILMAHKRHSHCSTAYRYLQESIHANLSPTASALIAPYLDGVILALQSHA